MSLWAEVVVAEPLLERDGRPCDRCGLATTVTDYALTTGETTEIGTATWCEDCDHG